MQNTLTRIFHFKHYNFIFSLFQPWSGQIECLLRADIPETSQRFAIYPDSTFAPLTHIHKAVTFLLYCKRSFMESRNAFDGFAKLHFRNFFFIQRQWSDRPSGQLFISPQNLAGDTFPVKQYIGAIVDASGIFYQNLQCGRCLRHIQGHTVLIITTIQAGYLLTIYEDHSIVTQILYDKFLFSRFLKCGLIMNISEINS